MLATTVPLNDPRPENANLRAIKLGPFVMAGAPVKTAGAAAVLCQPEISNHFTMTHFTPHPPLLAAPPQG